MPTVRPTNGFQRWVNRQFQPVERSSIASVVQDLDDYGIPTRDPDLFVLDKSVAIASRQVPALAASFFILPAKISTGVFRSRRLWFGLSQIEQGHDLLNGLILVLTAWEVDPGLRLVAAQDELKALVSAEFP